ncbi:MAG TPA: hypothetical protein V6C84_08495 [Coleofasciculaceae cyanobacterium]|jgi:hypothetical protein
MKTISAIAWAILSASLAVHLPSFSLPLEQQSAFVDMPICYMQNRDGSVVNLNSLCNNRIRTASQPVERSSGEVNALGGSIAGDTCDAA